MNSTRITRRRLVAAGALAPALGQAGDAVPAQTPTLAPESAPLTLWYTRAAGPWVEALPVGNGRLGAMVFGRPAQERLQLNIDTLHAGGPYVPDNPKFRDALPQARALIAQGRWHEAQAVVDDALMARPRHQMPFGSAGDLFLDFPGLRQASAYRRSLDLDTAIAHTRFQDGACAHRREVFSSVVDQVVVIRLEVDADGALDLDIGHRHPGPVDYGSTRPAPQGVAFVGADWDHRESLRAARRPGTLSIGPDGDGALLIQGRNEAAHGVAGALRYALRVQVVGDGELRAVGDRLSVRGARTLTVLVAGETSHVDFGRVDGDPVEAVRRRTRAAAARPWAAMRADHVRAHQALFRTLDLQIGDAAPPAATSSSTDQRVAAATRGGDASLTVLYVQYARYLLLSCSRPGSQPANLQGLWNEGVNPPWGSKYTININTQMNYWPAGPANLGVCVEPLLLLVEDLAVTGARTARDSYGARGWVAHHNTDLWRASAPIDGALWGMWPLGGAWLCLTLWDCHQYQPQPGQLARLLPLLTGASQFFLDTLVVDPASGGLVTSPSISPENEHHRGAALCAGPAMDRQILRDLFDATLQALALSGPADPTFTAALRRARERLPTDRIGAQGQLQEWLDDWDGQAPDRRHRHVSHLYAVYPSSQINVRDTPALAKAARVTLDARGDESTGWATAWRLALWARLGDAERAHRILLGLLGPVRTYPNLLDAHPPFQIDGNFGGAAGILEMLLQSWGGELHLLPALPRAWPSGHLHGARARGGLVVDLDWAAGRLVSVRLQGPPQSGVTLRHGGRLLRLRLGVHGRGQAAGGDFAALS
ncbi:glycoside hydrolase family 95 protein [Aquabacterium sp. OR-4]|uniref:glycoside hydrolase family 95 protein n=1 Tax=Aquabacterium sp. OR-4 TaxID=2978127 RepID=UPI0028CAE0BC|nr:glycoside hydrolase family 95 protein [Aquabacterium sp. OR-4]MDT7838589.1 glycoside hydrolase family 95 protein [Aquabacterium sp. OR-4]